LVSGAAGYIGGAIARRLAADGFHVFGGVRRPVALPDEVEPLVTGDLAALDVQLPAVDAVVHAAGLGHRRGVSQAVWRAANVDAAVNLAQAARQAGATRFVLISTAHVHGRVHDGMVTDTTPPHPMDDYAASKLAAEQAVAAAFGQGLSILRPVAVIGPHCPGNLQLLMKLLARGIPLPFGAIANKRSFIGVNDLARLLAAVLAAEAPPQVVLAAHPESIATPALVRALAAGMGVKPRLLPCPPGLLAAGAGLLGRAAMWQSLAGSFVADPRAALALGWAPGGSLEQGLAETGRYYPPAIAGRRFPLSRE
jgi:UDP-glucose 4-epimerase